MGGLEMCEFGANYGLKYDLSDMEQQSAEMEEGTSTEEEAKQHFRAQMILFTMMGLQPADRFKFPRLYRAIRFVLLMTLFDLVVRFTILNIEDYGKLSKWVETFLFIIVTFNCHNKLASMILHQKELLSCFSGLEAAFARQLSSPREALLLRNTSKRVHSLLKGFLALFGSCASFAFVKAVGTTYVIGLNSTGNNTKMLAFRIWIPMDYQSPGMYLLVMTNQTYVLVACVLSYFGTYGTLCSLTIHISAQIKILRMALEDPQIEARRVSDTPALVAMLRQSVDQYKFVISLVETANKIFGDVLYLELILSSLQTCMAVFQLSKVSYSDPQLPFLVFFVVCTTLMPILVCRCGEEFKSQSSLLRESVYMFPWYLLSPPSRKEFIITQTRTNTLLTLRAREQFFMDIETLGKTFQAAYSYLTILKSFDN